MLQCLVLLVRTFQISLIISLVIVEIKASKMKCFMNQSYILALVKVVTLVHYFSLLCLDFSSSGCILLRKRPGLIFCLSHLKPDNHYLTSKVRCPEEHLPRADRKYRKVTVIILCFFHCFRKERAIDHI